MDERRATGKALRRAVPRAAHAEFKTFPGREDPLTILKAQAKTRLPQFVPIRDFAVRFSAGLGGGHGRRPRVGTLRRRCSLEIRTPTNP